MMCLISGETVTVRSAAQSFDELGEPTGETVTEAAVDNVVVCPGATADLDSTRPNGVTVAYTLCFPKARTLTSGTRRSRCAAPTTRWSATPSDTPRPIRPAPGTSPAR